MAEVDTMDDRNRTPLWIASKEGHLEVAQLLVGAAGLGRTLNPWP